MIDMVEFSPQRELLEAVRMIRIGGNSVGDVEELGLGEANQGTRLIEGRIRLLRPILAPSRPPGSP
jgi:hypothetical protein